MFRNACKLLLHMLILVANLDVPVDTYYLCSGRKNILLNLVGFFLPRNWNIRKHKSHSLLPRAFFFFWVRDRKCNLWLIYNVKRTRVVWIPTLSAASNAIRKLRRLSCGVRVSYGIFSFKYECNMAQNASPSFHDELKLVMSIFR